MVVVGGVRSTLLEQETDPSTGEPQPNPGSVTILLGQEHPSWSVCEGGVAPPLLVVVWYPHVVILSPTSLHSASKTPPAGDLDSKVDRGRYRRANIAQPGKHGFLRLRFAINSLYRSGRPVTWKN